MEKKWQIRSNNAEVSPSFDERLALSDDLKALLALRGITSTEHAQKFLNPSMAELSDARTIPGIPEAVSALSEAVRNKEKICIYGDYDVDGVTATVVLVSTLRELGADVRYYIPHRYHEGYSLNTDAIDALARDGVSWMVTVDCGISDPHEINYAEQKGMKTIVTDHHNSPETLPNAHAIIDPKCGPVETPYYFLAGVGVAFKFAQALYLSFGHELAETEKYLDLVTLGTVADMVPLVGENRALVSFGLKRLAQTVWPGIASLKKTAGLKQNKHVSTRSIGFMLAPRINAAGRLEKAELAVELLLSRTQEEAAPYAAQLDVLNKKRQEVSNKIFEDAKALIDAAPGMLANKVIILSKDGWNPGVTGIAASQLVRAYNRPVVLVSVEGESARGSIRSPESIDIYKGLQSCGDLFINYGGHQEAAGFEIAVSKLAEFRERYIAFMNAAVDEARLSPVLRIDMPIHGSHISTSFVHELERLAPYGQGNSVPVFCSDSLDLLDFRQVGDGSHLKCTFAYGNETFDSIGFGLGKYAKILSEHTGKRLELAFTLEFNDWNGEKRPQLSLIDMHFPDGNV